MRLRAAAIVVLTVGLAGICRADIVQLNNGDTLRGKVVSLDAKQLRKELGPEASVLNPYRSILDNFIRESTPPAESSQPPAAPTSPPSGSPPGIH